MWVALIAHTPNPEQVCARAMMGCQSRTAAYELNPNRQKTEEMIRKAKKMKHLSVLEHANFTFSVKNVSRVLTHQLVRHRIASYSQSSGRARDFRKLAVDDFIMPESIKKAGIKHNSRVFVDFKRHLENSVNMYSYLVAMGVPREDARFALPQATPQNMTFTMNARELLHFFYLRCSQAAQWEIREMANEMLKRVKEVAPVIFEDGGKYEC